MFPFSIPFKYSRTTSILKIKPFPVLAKVHSNVTYTLHFFVTLVTLQHIFSHQCIIYTASQKLGHTWLTLFVMITKPFDLKAIA